MSKRVLESFGLALEADSRVDAASGIITGVKVLGSRSKNGRVYPPALLAERFAVYESAQVYADHDYGQLKTGRERPMQQLGGVLRGVTCRGDSIFSDLHCLKETPAGRVILEAAQRCPDKFGLSPMHLIDARKEKDGTETVTAILECLSVDAVTRPATTKTLFEAEETPMDETAAPAVPPPPSIEDAFLLLQNAVMADAGFDDAERLSVLKDVMKLKSKVLGNGEEEPAPEGGAGEPPPEGEAHVLPTRGLKKQVSELAGAVRALTIRQMAGEGLRLDAVTMAGLLALADDAQVEAQLERLRHGQRRRYSGGPARSSGRHAAAEAAAPPAVPQLSKGADREQVKKYYRG